MTSYAHKALVEQLVHLNKTPTNSAAFAKWIEAGEQLDLLRQNGSAAEIIIHAAGPFSFIHSMVVPNEQLSPPDQEDLLRGSCNPYTTIASYVYGGNRKDVWIERGGHSSGSKTLQAGTNLIFGRSFEGWSGKDRSYFELNQEYTHLAGIHWRPEHNAYCRFDENGDIEFVASVTNSDGTDDVTLVSFAWETLETYLAISKSSLVRLFDFTLYRRDSFEQWPDGPEQITNLSEQFFYRRKLTTDCGYSKGVQVLRPRRAASQIMSDFKSGTTRNKRSQYVEFIAYDFRNKRVTKISTDPKATTNYFETDNTLPFELSPAFFRPEVLLKYKTDREKYKVGERDIHCRSAWTLRGFDINDAGQIHAYICDVQNLPYSEQLHWLSFNEDPKTGISKRAIVNDFKGEFADFAHPLENLLAIIRGWNEGKVVWWTLRDDALLGHVTKPVTSSKDEWSRAFLDLSKLVVEGFVVKSIRKKLDAAAIAYDAKEQSIALLEKVVGANSKAASALTGLRTIQLIRSKVEGHAGGGEGQQLARDAIANHGSYAAHFKHVCEVAVIELQWIENSM